MLHPDGPYALCWLARGTRYAYRARIAPRLVADAVELAQQARERWPDRVFWIEAWPEEDALFQIEAWPEEDALFQTEVFR